MSLDERIARASRLVADLPPVVLTGFILVLLARTVAQRIGYPYDLEWMEGGMLLHSLRVLQGQPIYVVPSADFIPYLYPPLYSWVVAGLSLLPGVGLSLTLGRAVSLVGTLVACGALVAAARIERVTWAVALAGAGLYLSCYEDSGAFYDLVRTDGLLMALVTWSLVAARTGRLRLAGLLLACAFATKQTFAIFGLPTVVWLMMTGRRRDALRFALYSAVPALLFTVGMAVASDGAFLTWMLRVPTAHGVILKRILPGTPKELWHALPWSDGLTAALGLLWVGRSSEGGLFWLAQGLVALGLSAFMRGHTGGFINVLMPAHWTLALWATLATGAAIRRWEHPLVRGALGAVLALQIGLGRWDPRIYTPTTQDREAGDALVEQIRGLDGEVLSPYAPWLPVLAGKTPYWHLIALWDIDYEHGPYYKASKSIDAAIARKRWGAVIVSEDDDFKHGLKLTYKRSKRIPYKGRAFYPKTGWKKRPSWIYLPLPEGEQGTPDDPPKKRDVPPDPTDDEI